MAAAGPIGSSVSNIDCDMFIIRYSGIYFIKGKILMFNGKFWSHRLPSLLCLAFGAMAITISVGLENQFLLNYCQNMFIIPVTLVWDEPQLQSPNVQYFSIR